MAAPTRYNHISTERLARLRWANSGDAPSSTAGKYYCLAFPTSIAGKFHFGHCRNHVLSDIMARHQRMRGHDVLHAVGWDTLGLTTQAAAHVARKTPATWSTQQVQHAQSILARLGISPDKLRQIRTDDRDYCRWQQELFIKLWQHAGLVKHERQDGVAYWDPGTASYISRRQLVNGRGPESGILAEVHQVKTYEITVDPALADELYDGLESLPRWGSFVKNMQRESIGRERGLTITLPVHDKDGKHHDDLDVFTSRPDTMMGTTFVAVGVDHPLACAIAAADAAVAAFCAEVTDATFAHERLAEDKHQEGMPLCLYAQNPLSGDQVPVWVANFIIADYGTNAVLGVPAHDQRNFNFAQRHNLPLRRILILSKEAADLKQPLHRPLTDKYARWHCNSGPLEGPLNKCKQRLLDERGASEATLEWQTRWDSEVNQCVQQELAKANVSATPSEVYRLRNWKISSQNYWGCPVPLVHCDACGTVPVPAAELPVELPSYIDNRDSLADYPEFITRPCPCCGAAARRDIDTFDSLFGTACLHARLACTDTDQLVNSRAAAWLPVDFHSCGTETTATHLLCTRLLHRLLHKVCDVDMPAEPITHLLGQGMVCNYGLPMADHYANAIEPDRLLDDCGADTLRLYLTASVDPRHPLHWDDQKLYALRGLLTEDEYDKLCTDKLNDSQLERLRQHLSASEITRLRNGLLNTRELAQLRNGTLSGDKLAAVKQLLEPREIKRLQTGVLSHKQLRLLRSDKLDTATQTRATQVLTTSELRRLRNGLLDPGQLRALCAAKLPANLTSKLARCIPTATVVALQGRDIDPSVSGVINALQQEFLDAHEDAGKRPLLNFLDRERMDILLYEIDKKRIDRLVNFVDLTKLETLLGFCGCLWHTLLRARDMVVAGRDTQCADARRAQLHLTLKSINHLYGTGSNGGELVLNLNRVVNRCRELLKLLDAASNPDNPDDCALAAEICPILLQVLHPLLPHVTEQLWAEFGNDGLLAHATWPQPDKAALAQGNQQVVVVQLNGRRRLELRLDSDAISDDNLLRQHAHDALTASTQTPSLDTANVKQVKVIRTNNRCVVNFVVVRT